MAGPLSKYSFINAKPRARISKILPSDFSPAFFSDRPGLVAQARQSGAQCFGVGFVDDFSDVVNSTFSKCIGIEQYRIKGVPVECSSRVQDSPQYAGGTGLGLCICLKIAELYKGRTGVESAECVGSTFSVTAPPADEGISQN